MASFHLLLVALLAMDCTGVHGKLMFYGEGVSNVNQQEFINQICPKPGTNERKYVRIRTFNDKYIFAYATDSGDNSYLRTRCCGAKDAVGRSDVKVPGRRTTFLIHCQRIGNENTFKFEILNGKNNNPSGYYFYADLDWAKYGIWAEEYTDDPDSVYFEFVLHRWRGPVIGIRTYRPGTYPSNWVTFGERRNSDGRVTAFRNLVYDKKNSLPNFADTYTLEAVPSGCVDGASQRNVVWAAPAGTEHEECESKPDRCYWTDGWYVGRRRWLPGTCYYNKDSMCWWERGSRAQVPADRKCIVNGATIPDDSGTCEAANCCFDYKKNQCYKPL